MSNSQTEAGEEAKEASASSEPMPSGENHDALRDFLHAHKSIQLEAGEVLIRQGDASETAFFLQNGSVLVQSETPYGPVPLATLHGPRLLGEIGVLAGLPRTASVKVLSPSEVIPISRQALLEIGEKAPGLFLSVIGQLGRQIASVNRAISLYTNALSALEKREFDTQILADLKNPTPELDEFAATFRRFADQILDKRRQQDEMASAALIQQSLLPEMSALAPVSGILDLHAEVRPARYVGGDFFDFFMLDESRIAVMAGDVCGKGIPASLFMAIVVTVLRMAAREEKSLPSAAARANAILCLDNASSMFATVFFAFLDTRTGHLAYCNFGHTPPIVSRLNGPQRSLEGSGLPIALFPDRTPPIFETGLDPEDTLLIFTDGVTEAMNKSGEEFGDMRLGAAVAAAGGLAARDFVARIFTAVDDFANGEEQSDDITCLALRLIPQR